jgi:integrase
VIPKRSYGTGSIYVKAGKLYGRWWIGDRRVKRKLGAVRDPGSRTGLTKSQAEREMRRRMDAETASVLVGERPTVSQTGERLIDQLEVYGLRPTTITIYRWLLRTHLSKHLGDRELARVTPSEVERMIAAMRRNGAGPKLINNALTLLGQTFNHGIDKGSCRANPVRQVRRPRVEQSNEIRFLDQAELEALLRAADSDTDRVLFLTAAMTGLRQGELLGLQWRDIDWLAGKLRVRRSYVRGHWGPPKSRRATRAVPMADRLAGELDRHHKASSYKADDDLVFGHPQRGTVLDHSDLVRRFKRALRTGGVREVRFHDLRHTFGTRMAAAGVPMRTLQEWMGHRDFKTTLIYADYAPSGHEAGLVERAFAQELGPNWAPASAEAERPTVPR